MLLLLVMAAPLFTLHSSLFTLHSLMPRLLIIRFSAMGDVAMMVPVVRRLALQYPDWDITVLTRQRLTQLFVTPEPNIHLIGVDLNDYKGFGGLNKLFKEMKAQSFDAVADFHDVLRTKYLRRRFRWAGVKVAVIDKGRSEKKQLLGNGLQVSPLCHTLERYADVLKQLSLPVDLSASIPPFESASEEKKEELSRQLRIHREKSWIGIAPFAAHPGKIYPLEQMHEVARQLASRGFEVLLFGAGPHESSVMESWEQSGITSVSGKLAGLHEEMQLMSCLRTMIAMDSANMHIASLTGIPVISIWGATHPKAGFTPWGQSDDHIIQDAELACRPCSIYGKKPCKYGDLRCMTHITPDQIVERTLSIMNTSHHESFESL